MQKLELAIILGTRRKNNKSQYVARHLERVAVATGDWKVTSVDPADLNITIDDEGDPAYTKVVARSDAFFVIMPEYNHGYPGSLKLILDSEYDLYLHKAVAIAGVSSGRIGGARGIVSLAEVLRRLGLSLTQTDVHVSDSYHAYNEETGEPNEGYIEQSMLQVLAELKWLATALKQERGAQADKAN